MFNTIKIIYLGDELYKKSTGVVGKFYKISGSLYTKINIDDIENILKEGKKVKIRPARKVEKEIFEDIFDKHMKRKEIK